MATGCGPLNFGSHHDHCHRHHHCRDRDCSLARLWAAWGQGLDLPVHRRTRWRRQWPPTPVLLPGESQGQRSLVGCSPWGREESDTTERLHFHALEKEMATHSSVLAWRIPGTGKPGGLPSMGLHRVWHDWSDLAPAAAAGGLSKCLLNEWTKAT